MHFPNTNSVAIATAVTTLVIFALLAATVAALAPTEFKPSNDDVPFLAAITRSSYVVPGIFLSSSTILTHGILFDIDPAFKVSDYEIFSGLNGFEAGSMPQQAITAMTKLSNRIPLGKAPVIITVDPSVPNLISKTASIRASLVDPATLKDGDELIQITWDITHFSDASKPVYEIVANRTKLVSDENCRRKWDYPGLNYTTRAGNVVICTSITSLPKMQIVQSSYVLMKRVSNLEWGLVGIYAIQSSHLESSGDYYDYWVQPWYMGKAIANATKVSSFNNGIDVDTMKIDTSGNNDANSSGGSGGGGDGQSGKTSALAIGLGAGLGGLAVLAGVGFGWWWYMKKKRNEDVESFEMEEDTARLVDVKLPHGSIPFAEYNSRPQNQSNDEQPPPYAAPSQQQLQVDI
ncbi:hypothetical protein GQ42DRAFT_89395 [Ramicandelaber brevisporus]|nr:hypothetical protein GQ42DRAFT_89395 [Ramicandelaber brevisporus]